jgi:hypothetical protein
VSGRKLEFDINIRTKKHNLVLQGFTQKLRGFKRLLKSVDILLHFAHIHCVCPDVFNPVLESRDFSLEFVDFNILWQK